MSKKKKLPPPTAETPPILWVTFHGELRGQTFDKRESADAYPGPRGYECHPKQVIAYIKAENVSTVVKKLNEEFAGHCTGLLEEIATALKD